MKRVQETNRQRKSKRNQDPSLVKIIVGITVVGAAILAVVRFSERFTADFGGGEVQASEASDLTRVEELIAANNEAEARKLLEPLIKNVDDQRVTPKALLLQAKLDLDAGNQPAALGHLRRAYEDYPGSAERPAAGLRYARLLEEQGDFKAATEVFAKIKETAPPEVRAGALAGEARQLERDGDLVAARDSFAQAVKEAEWNSETWDDAADGLGRLNVRLIFSPEPTPDSKIYEVTSGDSLTSIGNKLNTTQGLLMIANNITDPNALRLGQRLKYTPKDFRIVIDRTTCRLFLLDTEGLFKVYRVGLGKKGNETTLGSYKIGNKEKDPTWFKPGAGPIPPLDPRNELGTRWMPLVPEAEGLPRDLGIHGTIQPDSIGKYESMGCPRMLKESVEELYDLIVRSTPVTILDNYNPRLGGTVS